MENTKKKPNKIKKVLKILGIILMIPIVVIVAFMLLNDIFVVIDSFSSDNADIQYTVNSDQKTCTVIGANPSEDYALNIPKEIDGYVVTGIAEEAFKDYEMQLVILPDTIEKIGKGAFYNCHDLMRVQGLEKCTSLISISDSTFELCINLMRMKLPPNIQFIGDNAFYGCQNWRNATIPPNTQQIGTLAYAACFFVKDIYIPKSVETLGDMAFLGCSDLININVDEANPYWSSVDGVLYSKDLKTLYCYPTGKRNESFTIPEGVEHIYYKAFALTLHLKEINLPNTIRSIGEQVFVTAEHLNDKIEVVNFNGTINSWKSIKKPTGWGDNSLNFTVYCADGTIAKDGTVTYK